MWLYIRVLKVVVIQASALPQVTQEITIRDIFNDHKNRIFEVEQRKVGLKVHQNILLPGKAGVLCFHVMKASGNDDDDDNYDDDDDNDDDDDDAAADDDDDDDDDDCDAYDDYNEDEEHGKLVTLMALIVKITTMGKVERGLTSTPSINI